MAGQFAVAERLLAESVAAQRALAEESGVELPYACWPLLHLGKISSFLGHYARSLARHQAALAHARKFHEQPCVIAALTGVARILAAEGRWQESAQLYGAAEAYCDQSGYPFRTLAWQWQRVAGLPEPWQRGEEPFGRLESLREAVVASGPPPLPPLPDPAAAAELWAAGRSHPIEDAVDYALSLDLTKPPAGVGAIGIAGTTPSATRILSAREQEVLVLLCQRLTDPQIAERLYLSPRTVESHVASLLRKLDVANRRDAVAVAIRLDLV
jgi:DNA-binding CsgD family transcriptional regulator